MKLEADSANVWEGMVSGGSFRDGLATVGCGRDAVVLTQDETEDGKLERWKISGCGYN